MTRNRSARLRRPSLPPRASATRAAAALLAAALGSACGKKGPNLPPIRILPSPAQALMVRQIGGDVLLTARLPGTETDGTPLGDGARVTLLRMRATATLRPGAVSPRYLAHQFEKGAQAVLHLEGAALGQAAPAGALRYRDTGAQQAAGLAPGAAGGAGSLLYSVLVEDAARRRSLLPVPLAIEIRPPLPVPHDLKVETAEGEVRLGWTPGEGSAAKTLYNVYRRTKEEAGFGPLALNAEPIETPAYVDRGFVYGTDYLYVVRTLAGRQKPTRESADSPEVEVRPLDVFPPKTPTGIAASAEGRVIKVYWFPNSETDLAGYRIFRREGEHGEFTLLGQAGPAETSFTDSTAVPGVRYHYAVSAFDTATPPNESPRSEEKSETLSTEAPAPTPEKPR